MRLVIGEKLYGPYKAQGLKSLKDILDELKGNLLVEYRIAGVTPRNWVILEITGQDSEAFANYISQHLGVVAQSFDELSEGDVIRGRVVDSGRVGYGLYVDIGLDKRCDALIPLYSMRNDLARGAKLSARQLIKLFCLYDNLPVEVEIVSVDSRRNEIEAKFSENQLNIFERWMRSSLDRVIAFGATRRQLMEALRKTKHLRDVVEIQRLGLLEQVAACKLGTDGPGIIAEIGKHLPEVLLHNFSPKKIKQALSTAPS